MLSVYEREARAMDEAFGAIDATVEEPKFYFCLDHRTVEGLDGCRPEVRLGPYATADAASRALDTARQRTESWDSQDEEWDELQ
jgi:hypothetical protein